MLKNHTLKDYLARLADGGLCVAFSGGVDSAVVLKAAREVCENVHAVTICTLFHPSGESGAAKKLAESMGTVFKLIEVPVLPDEIMENPLDRCYLCKKLVFTEILAYARENGLTTVLDGTNADDLNEYRPGLRALSELGVKSPLRELNIAKSEVREIARGFELPVSDKPGAPCLATRLPYNTRIVPEMLQKLDTLEHHVKALDVRIVRARLHGDTVRIETPPENFGAVIENRLNIIEKAKELGFLRVTLDLEGFRSGSFDTGIKEVF